MLLSTTETGLGDRQAMTWVIFAAAACFAVTLGGTWIYDDLLIIKIDPRLRDLSLWHQYWTQSYHNGVDNLYRPLTSMTYAIQYALHGERAWAFHLVNVLLHALASALVWRLGRRLIGAGGGLLAGLLFAVHPVHVEAVANIVGRAELLCAVGSLIALLALLQRPIKPRHASWACAGFVIALLSKEQGMVLPLLMMVMLLALLLTRARPRLSPQEVYHLKICFLLIAPLLAGYIVLRENVLHLKFWWDRIFLDWTINPLVRPDADRTLMPLVLLGRYAGLLFFPISLSPDYGAAAIGWRVRWDEPWFYMGCASAAVWVGLMILFIVRRNGAMIFALFGLAITWGVVGNVVTLIGTNFGERLMYLPSVFFLLLLAAGIISLPRKIALTLAGILLFLGAVRTISYAVRWNDPLSFYQYAIEQQPRAIRLRMLVVSWHLQAGEAHENSGDFPAAMREYDLAAKAAAQAREILPEYHEIWIQSAIVAAAQNDFDRADAFLDESLKIKPTQKALGWKTRIAERRAATQPATQG